MKYVTTIGEKQFTIDINQDGQITSMDYTAWYNSTIISETGYKSTDINFDGQVTSMDYTLWYNNTIISASSTVSN